MRRQCTGLRWPVLLSGVRTTTWSLTLPRQRSWLSTSGELKEETTSPSTYMVMRWNVSMTSSSLVSPCQGSWHGALTHLILSKRPSRDCFSSGSWNGSAPTELSTFTGVQSRASQRPAPCGESSPAHHWDRASYTGHCLCCQAEKNNQAAFVRTVHTPDTPYSKRCLQADGSGQSDPPPTDWKTASTPELSPPSTPT